MATPARYYDSLNNAASTTFTVCTTGRLVGAIVGVADSNGDFLSVDFQAAVDPTQKFCVKFHPTNRTVTIYNVPNSLQGQDVEIVYFTV